MRPDALDAVTVFSTLKDRAADRSSPPGASDGTDIRSSFRTRPARSVPAGDTSRTSVADQGTLSPHVEFVPMIGPWASQRSPLAVGTSTLESPRGTVASPNRHVALPVITSQTLLNHPETPDALTGDPPPDGVISLSWQYPGSMSPQQVVNAGMPMDKS